MVWMADSLRPGSSGIIALVVSALLLLRTITSASDHDAPFPVRRSFDLSNLSAPKLLLAGGALDDLAGLIALFVEVEVAVWTVEVGADVAKAVFKVITFTHFKTSASSR